MPLEIYWTLNSALIVNGEHGFNIFKMNKRTSSLNIDSLEAMHRGTYKCIANNSAGFAEYVAELEVNGLFALLNEILVQLLFKIIFFFEILF